MTVDYYKLLNVNNDSATETIKAAYRSLARTLHPDVNPAADASERFQTILIAYQTLSDPEKRKAYDTSQKCLEILEQRKQKIKETLSKTATTQYNSTQNTQNESVKTNPKPRHQNESQKTPNSVNQNQEAVTDFFDSFASIFKEAIGSRTPQTKQQKPPQKALKIALTAKELKYGVTKTIEVFQKRPCKSCQSNANNRKNVVCSECGNTGKIKTLKYVTLTFPKNLASGEIINLPVPGQSSGMWVEVALNPN